MCAASLIKLFVMQKTYQDYDLIVAQDVNYSGDEQSSKEKIGILLESMIEWSDNESYNELMRMMSPQRAFSESCEIMNGFLEEYDSDHGNSSVHKKSPFLREKKIPALFKIVRRRYQK